MVSKDRLFTSLGLGTKLELGSYKGRLCNKNRMEEVFCYRSVAFL